MKFADISYTRADFDAAARFYASAAERLSAAGSFEEAEAVFLEVEDFSAKFDTALTVANIRHDIDTRDEFYDAEVAYIDEHAPELEEYVQRWQDALLRTPYRAAFEEKYNRVMFLNAEIDARTFSPEIVPELQRENALTTEYSKLLAGAQIPFEGGVYTLSQLTPIKQDADASRRAAAWAAEDAWYAEHAESLDAIYAELVTLRDKMGRKLGHDGYIPLGYDRLGRNCYGPEQVAAFREQIARDMVPIVAQVKKDQEKRLGVDKLKFYDDILLFPDGNADPYGTPEEILAAGHQMYRELSGETAEFADFLFDNGLLDVLSKDGKAPGGYCTTFPNYQAPFIFSNFNGTSGDVDVLTHEAGHAFAFFRSMRKGYPASQVEATIEACEVHSMAMEFLTAPWHEKFFGDRTRKYEIGHCEDALIFIPYGCMVDEFQHLIYENPHWTPAQRNKKWLELERKYRPWIDFADLPFYGRGAGWQRQLHIYLYPLYYIDYCMAQTVAFQFWIASMANREDAWARYLRFADAGGTKTFEELVAAAGLKLPYAPGCIREIGQAISRWISENNL